ncbi:tetratricopeptide repeat protein [Permianibacter sp. IMCC34836]|uniref:tetratricopeptide repeat protein n=1 Tax=Permianibacter fluminis TaxID=2738515 RepID=UPI001553075D|nr:tetratricopeptide repeat protein [Permianibacter fluminis]NQD36947.1 tetratricopeptide repeat protein [Permianibacter fluminis]
MPSLRCSGPTGRNELWSPARAGFVQRRTALLLTLSLLAAGCQSLPTAAPAEAVITEAKAPDAMAAEPTASPATEANATAGSGEANAYDQSQTYYQVLLGQLAQQRGENGVALNNLLAAAESSNDVTLARQAFSLALKQRDTEATLRAATLLAKLEASNPEARLALALAQLQNQQNDAALQTLEQALALVGGNENGQLALLGKFARAAGPDSLSMLAELSHQHPNPEWVLLAAAVQAQHFGDGPYAMVLLDKAMEVAPDYRRALLVKAELLANRDGDAAIALLQDSFKQHPDDRELALALGRTLYAQGQFPEAVAALTPFAKNKSDKEAGYLYAVSLYMAGELNAALPRLKQAAEAGEQTGPAGWLCAQAAERLKQDQQALACYDLVKPTDSQYAPAQRAKAELLSKAKRYDEALDVLTDARMNLDGLSTGMAGNADTDNRIRQQAGLLASQLRLLQQAGRSAEAKALFHAEPGAYQQQLEPALLAAGLDQKNPAGLLAAYRELRPEAPAAQLQWALTGAGLLQEKGLMPTALELLDGELTEQKDNTELLYAAALIAEPLGQHERCEADLRRVLALDPNHIDALNALGYTLADHNRQLDEALDLIQRAQRSRPTSAAIMDSLGWVHYRRGDLNAARNWLGRAFALEPEPEIAAHYGEVLWQLGDKKKARQIWRDAAEQAPDNQALKAVMARLK